MRSWTSPEIPNLEEDFGIGLPLQVWNTQTQKLETVDPDDVARMYVCGITPYDATHIGHAATYLTFDLINRVWRDRKLTVNYVQNVTDIDDPLLERANQTNEDWRAIAERETEIFRSDMEALAIIAPSEFIGAVESMNLVEDMLDKLAEKNAVYQVDEDWYFDITIDEKFGSLSHYGSKSMLELCQARGGDPQRPGKHNPLDCIVWQKERSGEPSWESSRGRGRPGWHIECGAIATKYLGTDFDIQGGGSDLVFPHHEMSASQARIANGEEFAKTYVHTAMVAYQGEKMSKSLGNLVFVSKLRASGVEPAVIRLALLNRHYRTDWGFSTADLDLAKRRLDLWRSAIERENTPHPAGLVEMIREALAHDLDAPRALRAMDFWSQASGTHENGGAAAAKIVDALLGIRL